MAAGSGWKRLAIIASVAAVAAAIVAVVVGLTVPCSRAKGDADPPTANNKTCRAFTVAHRETSQGRLPTNVRPVRQLVELQPHIYSGAPPFPFDGKVEVRFEVESQTDVVYLKTLGHDVTQGSVELTVASDSPVAATSPTLSRWDIDRALEFFKVFVDGYLQQGAHYVLKFYFNGTLNKDVGGFYSDSYIQDNTVRYLASTQHERLGWARQTFPGWDEPGYKAQYEVVVVRRDGWTALSNMPLRHTTDRGDGWFADYFETSPPMSAYTLCVTVFQFGFRQIISNNGHVIRVWTRPDLINSTDYPLRMAAGMLDWFGNWTEIAYPLPKMDIMGLPSRPGAMENWGLMSYAEFNLLYDPTYHDLPRLYTVARIMAHELAHQWFGNLVTCRWWDDIWLNEAFASYFENFPLQDVADIPGTEVQLLGRSLKALTSDAVTTSTPVRRLVATPTDAATIFTTFVYSKGSTILKTMHAVLGDSTFRRAIKRYLNRHAYSDAIAEDLWNAFTEQAEEDGVTDTDGLKLFMKEKFDPWVDQRGFPLLTIDRQQPGVAMVTQSPFLNPKDADVPPAPFNNEWCIPISVHSQDDTIPSNVTLDWLNRENKTINRGLPGDLNKWFIVNVERTAFYRVQYDQFNKALIEQQLLDDHTVFNIQNRAGLMDDAFQQVRSGRELQEVSAMNMTRHMDQEDGYVMWVTFQTSLQYMSRLLPRLQDSYDRLQSYKRSKAGPVFDRLGWTDGTDGPWVRMARALVADIACASNYTPCVDQALAAFGEFKQNPSPNPIAPDRRNTAYCTALAHGDESDWGVLFHLYNSTLADSLEADHMYWKNPVLRALACPTNETLLQKYLEYIMDPCNVRDSDVSYAMESLASSNGGRQVVWEHLNSTWSSPSEPRYDKVSALMDVAEGLMSDGDVTDVNIDVTNLESFITRYPAEVAFESANSTVTMNNRWANDNIDELNDWFDKWS